MKVYICIQKRAAIPLAPCTVQLISKDVQWHIYTIKVQIKLLLQDVQRCTHICIVQSSLFSSHAGHLTVYSFAHIYVQYIAYTVEEVCIMLQNMKYGAETEIHFARSHLRFSGPLMHRLHFSVSVHTLLSGFLPSLHANTYSTYIDMNSNIIVSLCFLTHKILRNTAALISSL